MASVLRLVVPVDGLADRRLRGDHAATTWRFVMNATSSSANTLVGSAMARVSELPMRLTGSTSYFRAMGAGTSLQHVRIDVELGERDRGDAVLSRQEPDQLVFVDEVQPDEDRAELLGGALLLRERPLELLLGDESVARRGGRRGVG